MSRRAYRFLGLLACALLGCHRGEAIATFQVDWQPLFPDPHRHTSDINQSGLREDLKDRIRFVEVLPPRELHAWEGVRSPDRAFRAIALCAPLCRLLVLRRSADLLREIHVPSFSPERPFERLVWLDRGILIFDQRGLHYAVDVTAERLLQAVSFSPGDEANTSPVVQSFP